MAIDYFYEYLESLEEQENDQIINSLELEQELQKSGGSHTNNFRILALYMDLRCYESIIRKVKESRKFQEALKASEA